MMMDQSTVSTERRILALDVGKKRIGLAVFGKTIDLDADHPMRSKTSLGSGTGLHAERPSGVVEHLAVQLDGRMTL